MTARIPVSDFVWWVTDDGPMVPVSNAKVYAFLADGAEITATSPPTGTAIAGGVYDSFRAGAPVSFPLVTPDNGTFAFYMTYPQPIVVVVTDNDGAASLPDGTTVSFAANQAAYMAPGDGGVELGSFVTLTDGATVAWDLSAGRTFQLTAGGSRTIASPTNIGPAGTKYTFILKNGLPTAITTTWPAEVRLAGNSWTDPGASKYRVLYLESAGSFLREIGRSGGDET